VDWIVIDNPKLNLGSSWIVTEFGLDCQSIKKVDLNLDFQSYLCVGFGLD
jgi:hypothetical protein